MDLIKLEKINKKYGNHEIIHDFSITIKENEFLAICGESGSGKTTLLNIIGLLDSYDGNYYLEDKNLTSLNNKEKAKIRNEYFGYIFQNYYLDDELSVYENCQIPLLLSSKKINNYREKILNTLDILKIKDKADTRCSFLSGGEQQRVSIARALINDPKIILADEPCGALDSKNSTEVIKILSKLHQLKKTIILVTHNANEAEKAQRIIRIVDGRMITDEKL